jgi:hypothetical protein
LIFAVTILSFLFYGVYNLSIALLTILARSSGSYTFDFGCGVTGLLYFFATVLGLASLLSSAVGEER